MARRLVYIKPLKDPEIPFVKNPGTENEIITDQFTGREIVERTANYLGIQCSVAESPDEVEEIRDKFRKDALFLVRVHKIIRTGDGRTSAIMSYDGINLGEIKSAGQFAEIIFRLLDVPKS